MLLNVASLDNGSALTETMPEVFSLSEGVKITARADARKGYVVRTRSEKGIEIGFAGLDDLMMALGDIAAGTVPGKDGDPVTAALDFRGVMLDASRNAVPTVDFLEKALLRLAMLGINHFCLYTEDTFEVEGEPLIGYGRGAYAKDEIRRLVLFGEKIGVTLFPCFQTLGHFEQILKYQKYKELGDNNRVLNVAKPETYEFLAKIIENVTEPYNSDLTHLGMDEPWGLGRGRSLDFDNPVEPGERFAEHLAKVAEICREKKLQPIIWGDYILGHSGEKALSDKQAGLMPKSVIVDYWDYFHRDEKFHLDTIDQYRALGYEPLVSPGTHGWHGYWCKHHVAERTITPFLSAVHEKGVKRALITMWGDDGHECVFDNSYAALALYAAWCREREPDDSVWKKRLETIVGAPFANYAALAKIDDNPLPKIVDTRNNEGKISLWSKTLFYDDPLLAVAGRMMDGDTVFEYYQPLAEELESLAVDMDDRNPAECERLLAAASFCRVLALKDNMGRTARAAYAANDDDRLRSALELMPELEDQLFNFHALYKRMWLRERKPFGLEVVDNRIGGMRARLETFEQMVEDYLAGDIESIPEFGLKPMTEEFWPSQLHCYSRVASRCLSIWN